MAALLALTSALAYGVGDFFGGLSARRLPAAAVVLRAHAFGLAGLVLVLPLVATDPRGSDLAVGVAGGLAGSIALVLFYRGLALGAMSVVAPITAVLSGVVPVVFGLGSGERPSALALAGIPLALLAVALLARESGEPDPTAKPDEANLTAEPDEPNLTGEPDPTRKPEPTAESWGPGTAAMTPGLLASALGAGFGFGLYFVTLGLAGDQAGLWPLVSGRVTSVALLTVIVLTTGAARVGDGRARRGALPVMLAACGLLDASANALFLLATRHGMLTLVAVIGALYPASTLLLARAVLGERLARPQLHGVVLAGVAVTLVSAG